MNFELDHFIKVFLVIGRALPITISIAVFAMAFGLISGTLITFLRKSPFKLVNSLFDTYVSFFRGTPLMVQLFLFFFGLPQILPFFAILDAYNASIVVMSINASAYISEIIRSALNSVDNGQFEAAVSMGMTKSQTMTRIILPQALRIAIPPLGNTFINLIQGTSLTFMLGLQDIMAVAKMSAASTYRFFETYMAVGIIYWIITTIASKGNKYLERKLNYELN